MKELRERQLMISALALLLVLPALQAAEAQTAAPSAEAYGYFRTVEGRTLLSSVEPEETREVEVNVPLLSGDAVRVDPGARLEAVLADGTVARLEAGSELIFDELALSPDSSESAVTRLVLLDGELQLHVPDAAVEPEPPSVESHNSRIYLLQGGSYWIGVSGQEETFLVVREGTAEVLTEEGSMLVHGGQEARIAGSYRAQVSVSRAGGERQIELWAANLEAAAYRPAGPVEERLHYAAAPLERSGSWVYVDGRRAWRPQVRYGWRPFTDGYWVYTPSGLTWVAQEPWGWVTAHYGTWDFVPSYGWCWFPGTVYSPAWVYWYWGPSHAAWIPYGYYTRHYGRWNYGFRFGVYGWASGGWSVFADWTFCPLTYFGRRGGRYHHRSGAELARDRRALAVPRGLITTDTRGLGPRVWQRPYEVRQRLIERHEGRFAERRYPGSDGLPDVTSFVARRQELPENVRQMIKPASADESRPALRGRIRAREEADSRDRARYAPMPLKPADESGRQLGAGIPRGRDETPIRFERKPLERPSEFRRAPTSVYSRPGDDRRVIVRMPEPGDSPAEGSSRSGEVERPSSFERAPTPIYTRPDDAGESRSPERQPIIQRPERGGVYDRSESVDRSPAPRPTPQGRVIPTKPAAPERPSSSATSSSSSSSSPARRVVESARSRSSSGSSASSSGGSSRSRVQSRSSSSRSSSARSSSSSSGSRSSSARSSSRSRSSSSKKKDN